MSRPYDSIIRKLHSALKIDNLWPQFIEAIAEELDVQLKFIELTKYQKDILAMSRDVVVSSDPTLDTSELFISNLLLLAEKYGYEPNLILDDSFDFIVKELLSIPIKIKYKGTYTGYTIPIREIGYSGDIYNFLYNTDKMIKMVKWSSIITAYTSISDFTLPFYSVTPDKNYSSLVNQIVFLDSNPIRKLDEKPSINPTTNWFLDGKYQQILTKHLGIEVYIKEAITANQQDFLLTEDYFKYLEKAVDYNASMGAIPHVGCSINFAVPSDNSFDEFNTSEVYTVPLLKLKTNTTIHADGVPSLSAIKFISVGTGTQYIPDHTTKDILGTPLATSKENIVMLYSLTSPDTIMYDLAPTPYNATVVGNLKKTSGMFGQEVTFDGNTYVVTSATAKRTITRQDQSWIGWFDNTDSSSEECGIYDCGLIKITCSDTSLKVYYDRSISPILNVDNLVAGPHFVNIVFDMTNNIASLYVDDEIKDFYNEGSGIVGMTSFNTPTQTVMGAYLDDNNAFVPKLSSCFTGKISNVCLTKKTLSSEERGELYTNTMTLNASLKNPLARFPIADKEKFEDSSWIGINTFAPALTVNDEILFQKQEVGTTEVRTGVTRYKNIIPKTFNISYRRFLNGNYQSQSLKDDGNGNLTSDYLSGTIDYNTGEYLVKFFNTFSYDNSYTLEGTPTNVSFNLLATLGNTEVDIVPGSVKVYYKINGYYFLATDSGESDIVGSNLINSTLDHASGLLTLNTVGTSLPLQDSIVVSFDYYKYSNITLNEVFIANYKIYQDIIEQPIRITELALEDENHSALIYCTFPPIEFHSINDYLATNIMVRKLPT